MTNYVMLNHADHRDLKVDTSRSIELGDGVNFAMTFPFEFRNIQAHYPIFFQKDNETGKFFPVALLGFEANENLFLDESGWRVRYVPAMIRRQPFLIGFQDQKDDSGKEEKNAVVVIDIDNPRVNKDHGEPLFLEHGGTSDYLQQTTNDLELIHQAHEHSDNYVDTLIEHGLLEQFTLEISLADGSSHQLHGFYTIDESKLQNLKASVLDDLNQHGFLMPSYMVVASHSCLRDLIEEKNNRLTGNAT